MDSLFLSGLPPGCSEEDILGSLSLAKSLVDEYEKQGEVLRQQLADAVRRRTSVTASAIQSCQALKAQLTAGVAELQAELEASEDSLLCAAEVSRVVSSSSTDVKAASVIEMYLKSLWPLLKATDSIRADLERDLGPALPLPRLVAISKSLVDTSRSCLSLPTGNGRSVVARRCAYLALSLRASLSDALSASLRTLGWPKLDTAFPPSSSPSSSTSSSSSPSSSAVGSLVATLAALHAATVDLRAELPQDDPASVACSEPSWAAAPFAAPLITRFRYHFRSPRPSNRPDKPEWLFVHVSSALRSSAPFLAAAGEAAAASLDGLRAPMESVTSLFSLCTSLLLAEVSSRVSELAGSLLHNRLFVHLIDEVVSFEKQMREEFGYVGDSAAHSISCLHPLEADVDVMDAWLKWDRSVSEERLMSCVASAAGWGSRFDDLRDLVQFHPSSGPSAPSSAGHQPSNSADLLLSLLEATTDMCRMLYRPGSKVKLAAGVILPLLRYYTSALDEGMSIQNLEGGVWTLQSKGEAAAASDSSLFVFQPAQVGEVVQSVKRTLNSASVMRGFEMFGISVVARSLLAQTDSAEAVVEAAAAPPPPPPPQVAPQRLFDPIIEELSQLCKRGLDRCARACSQRFAAALEPYAKLCSEPGGLASRVRDSSNLDLSQEMCVVVSEFRHLLAFVGSRLARHVFVGVLFQVSSAGVCPQVTRLLALTQTPGEHAWLDGLQCRHDIQAVLAVLSSLAGQAHWGVIKAVFADVLATEM